MSDIVGKCRGPLIITTDIYFLELKKNNNNFLLDERDRDKRGINGMCHVQRSIFQFATMFLTLK